MAALEREIALLQDLDHPNIVQYLGTHREGAKLFIMLEFCSGGSITAALQQFGPLSEAVIRRYCRQILTGLAYLHAHGIIHRGAGGGGGCSTDAALTHAHTHARRAADIKGSNLLVDNGVVKLADFGCSKRT